MSLDGLSKKIFLPLVLKLVINPYRSRLNIDLNFSDRWSNISKPILCRVPAYSSPGFPSPTTRNLFIYNYI